MRIPLALNAAISVYYQRIRPVLSHENVLQFVLPFATSTEGLVTAGVARKTLLELTIFFSAFN
jgi:hypothetical protein